MKIETHQAVTLLLISYMCETWSLAVGEGHDSGRLKKVSEENMWT
jgi:hypothetical protein